MAVSTDFPEQKQSLTAMAAAKPWSVAVIYLVAGVALSSYLISYAQPNWRPPLERELIKVGGTFSDPVYTGLGYRPYIFIDDAGIQHTLGCEPEIGVVHCLEKAGTSAHALAGQHVVIGYFPVHTPWWEGRRVGDPEILMTVDASGRSILSFAVSNSRVRKTDAMENGTNYLLFTLPLAMVLFFFVTAARITVAKLRSNRRGN